MHRGTMAWRRRVRTLHLPRPRFSGLIERPVHRTEAERLNRQQLYPSRQRTPYRWQTVTRRDSYYFILTRGYSGLPSRNNASRKRLSPSLINLTRPTNDERYSFNQSSFLPPPKPKPYPSPKTWIKKFDMENPLVARNPLQESHDLEIWHKNLTPPER